MMDIRVDNFSKAYSLLEISYRDISYNYIVNYREL